MKKNATALFGGSFDPLTRAHLDVIKNLSERFDEVIVVPSHISPFKQGEDTAPDKVRMKLLEGECARYDNVSVSDFEISSDSVSYSCVTVKHFADMGKNIYFVIGSDMLEDLDKWQNTEYLKENSVFYLIPRPYFEIRKETLDKHSKAGFRFEFADFIGLEGSSSLLKVAVAFGREEEVVPQSVAKYVRNNGLYRQYCKITDLYARFNVKSSRVEHIYRTAKMAIILAKLHHVDVEKAIITALLHDVGKYTTVDELAKQCVMCDSKATTCVEAVRHCYTSSAIARDLVGVTDEDILLAIERHSTGDENMSKLQKLIFLADYIEEGRSFEGVEDVRKICYLSLSKGLEIALEKSIKYLQGKGSEIDARTLKAYEYIKRENHSKV